MNKIINKQTVEPGYFCRVYLCKKKAVNVSGDCEDHASALRTGKQPFEGGSAPVRGVKVDRWGWTGITPKSS